MAEAELPLFSVRVEFSGVLTVPQRAGSQAEAQRIVDQTLTPWPVIAHPSAICPAGTTLAMHKGGEVIDDDDTPVAYNHDARPDDQLDDRGREICKDCSDPITYWGVDPVWMHVKDERNG